MLGNDIELRLVQRPADAAEQQFLAKWGEISHIVELRAMAALGYQQETAHVIELKAVDGGYPLCSASWRSTPINPWRQPCHSPMAISAWSPRRCWPIASVSKSIVHIGELSISSFAACCAPNPIAFREISASDPRVMISNIALAQTGLDQPGSLNNHAYRLKLSRGRTPSALRNEAEQRFLMANSASAIPPRPLPASRPISIARPSS